MTIRQTNRLLWLGIAVMLFFNYLASATEKLGFSMTKLNTIFPFEFMPPGRAFMASWGIIYISLIVFFVLFVRYSITLTQPNPEYNKLAKLFWSSIVLNIAWIVSTTQQRWILSVVIIALLMITIYRIIPLLRTSDATLNRRGKFSRGIYLGWITVATIVLGISQAIFSFWGQWETLVLSNGWLYGILAFWLLKSLGIYYKIRNPYALAWSIFALGACAYAAFM